MVKQRSGGYKTIITPIALKRIKNNSCPNCGLQKSKWKRRTSWTCCSTKCTNEYWANKVVSFDWRSLRMVIFRRDNFSCVKCGRKPTREGITKKNWMNVEPILPGDELFVSDGIVIDTSRLVADHIRAIALGGEEWELKNIQTLCLKCNKIKTAEDAKKIAALRRWEKQEKKGQTVLSV